MTQSSMNTITHQSFGGQILRATLLGKEIFYCPENLQPPPTPARGGVPVLFPQFATLGNLPKTRLCPNAGMAGVFNVRGLRVEQFIAH
jgi:D-hexose-6-phosphate mutarotase